MTAGHTWVERSEGRVCSGCGKRWAEILGATKDDIGKLHIAHVGALTATELDEIVAEREASWRAGMGT